jgi:hypothetical protein
VNSPAPYWISGGGLFSEYSWTYSNGKVFFVGSLFVENVFGFENGLENVGFTIFVSLFVSCVKIGKGEEQLT